MALAKYFTTPRTLGDGDQEQIRGTTRGALVVAVEDASGNGNSASTPLYVAQSEISTNASASSATNIFSIDALYYSAIIIQFTSVGSGNAVTYEGSNDNATWLSVLVNRGENATSTANSVFTATLAHEIFVPLKFRYFRARISTYGSGTVTAYYALKSGPEPMSTTLRAGTASYGTGYTFGAIPLTQAGSTPSTARVMSAASTNATSTKASAGQVYNVNLYNSGTLAFIKFYNKASSPTVGTDTPVATYAIPASGRCDFSIPLGLMFTTGIAYAITGGVADSDTTAVTLNQVTGTFIYA